MSSLPPTAPSATPGQAPRLDADTLARLHELDPDGRHGVVRRVLVAFETSLTRMLVQLRGEIGSGQGEVVATVAHTLKSASASIGALDLARACADVETRLRAGDTAGLDRDITRLIDEGEAALAAAGAILRPRA
jgi:HPt (histidine-containing phosphotransfer) domain-containing protein